LLPQKTLTICEKTSKVKTRRKAAKKPKKGGKSMTNEEKGTKTAANDTQPISDAENVGIEEEAARECTWVTRD